jgi:ABC-type thiamine transport system ATPase subunit
VIGKSSVKGGQGQCCAGVFGEGGSTAMNLLAGKVLPGSGELLARQPVTVG